MDASPSIVELSGELDFARKTELRDALALPDSIRALVVDLAGVTYADSTALTELLRLQRSASARRVAIALVVASPQLARIVECAGLEQAFAIFPDRETALAHVRS